MSAPSRTSRPSPFPAGQLHVAVPERGPGLRRTPPAIPAEQSWARQRVRLWANPDGPAQELVPTTGPGDGPDGLLGCAEAWLVPGSQAFGRPTTPDEDADSLAALRADLGSPDDAPGWAWAAATVHPADNQWAQPGALVWNTSRDAVRALATRHGQPVVLRWSGDGLLPLATGSAVDGLPRRPVPVALRPAATGCPMRCGADGACVPAGGPWVSRSRETALVWQAHRRLLVEALDCAVCAAVPPPTSGDGNPRARPIGLAELFVPTREGGWAWGGPAGGTRG